MTHSASRLQASANSYHFRYVSLLNALVAVRDGNSLGSHWRPFFEVPFPVLIFSMTGSRSIIISRDDPTQRAVRSIFGIVRRRNLSTETPHQRFWLLVVVCKRHRVSVCLLQHHCITLSRDDYMDILGTTAHSLAPRVSTIAGR